MPSRTRKAHRAERSSVGASFLTGLLSLSAMSSLRDRRARPDRGSAGSGTAWVQSALVGLLSLSTSWLPWVRKPPQRGECKTAIMAFLVHVDHYEDRDTRRPVDRDAPGARSVGLSYREIQERVQEKYPDRSVSIMTIRSYARDAKKEGRAMPYRRPNSMRGRKTFH